MEEHGKSMAIEQSFICVTCGTQYSPSATPPARCAICEDERQYVGWNGQQWTTLESMSEKYRNTIREEERGLYSIHTEPRFGIGQRAFLLQTPAGNILWDCVSLVDDQTAQAVHNLGGISAIAVTHPHYYSSMVEWSRRFGNVPIYLNRADQRWVMRPDAVITFWDGVTQPLLKGLTLICTGGHFDGFQVLHWPNGADGRGVLLSGDQPQVCMDRRWVTFMYSYPNNVPLGPDKIKRIVSCLEPFAFDRIYGAFVGLTVSRGGKEVVKRSAERYLRAIQPDA